MKIMLILLAVSIVIFVATTIVRILADRYRDLPHFVWNYVGSKLAFVGINDYRDTPLAPRTGNQFRLVPETLVVSEYLSSNHRYTERGLREDALPGVFCPSSEDAKDLFVPYASERYLPYREQDSVFIPVPDREEFVERKKRENRKTDIRLRFRDFAYRFGEAIEEVQCWSLLVTIVLAVVCILGWASANDERRDSEPAVVYATAPGKTIMEIHTTERGQYKLLMYSDSSYGDYRMYSGKVVEVLEVGGGITQACISRFPGGRDCGSADSSLHVKIGDVIYIRQSQVMRWSNNGDLHQQPTNIVITEAEANQLLATGKFTINK